METETRASVDAAENNASAQPPRIQRLTMADLWAVLKQGQDDFFAKPTHGVFIVIIYALVAVFTVRIGLGESLLPIVLPIITGFSLLGPLAACGLYELSRRREARLDYSWWHVFDVFRTPSRWAILGMGIFLAVVFMAWLYTAMELYDIFLGETLPETMTALLGQLFATAPGWQLLAVGSIVGFLYSVVAYVTTVVSLPMMIDRKVGIVSAVALSLRAVAANWQIMAVWYLMVAGLFVVGSLPLFIGLALVIPILAHATWRLYRKLVSHGPEAS